MFKGVSDLEFNNESKPRKLLDGTASYSNLLNPPESTLESLQRHTIPRWTTTCDGCGIKNLSQEYPYRAHNSQELTKENIFSRKEGP